MPFPNTTSWLTAQFAEMRTMPPQAAIILGALRLRSHGRKERMRFPLKLGLNTDASGSRG